MLELIVVVGVCVIMAKVADAEDRSGIIWGCLTFVLCLGSFAVPLPFVRVLLAGIAAFALMFLMKAISER